ncbi:MAG: LysR family transcriptional regulator [Rhizobiaceae bacterium]|nr:MAG: LysR family transcriptional regulator [Rhizobiaceae bacterium]CAG1006681.1 HTH-type transcriptional regulator CynR [Rhizobiaceae bacterium]
MEKLNLRHLRAFLHVARCGSISGACEKVFLSQPAITQALAKLESSVGARLFLRKSTGMFPTEAGNLLLGRVDRALETLEDGARRGARAAGRVNNGGFRNFDQLLTTGQLRGFLALCRTGNYSWAARDLGVSRPSVHRSINDIERVAGFDMFSRSARGIEPTQAGDLFRRSVLLAFEELRQGLEEIELLQGRDVARVVVGSLPLAHSFILPRVINDLAVIRPDVRITVRDGSYGDLLHALRYSEIDILVGALRTPLPVDDVEQESLYVDRLAIVARAGHPLAARERVDAAALARFPWVTPSPDIPTRKHFDALFDGADLETPTRIVETSSLVLMRGLLMGSDRLAIISRHQVAKELEDGSLAALNFPLAGSERDIGIATRRGWSPTATQTLFIRMLREVCAQLVD